MTEVHTHTDGAENQADSDRYNVPALERGLNILSCFGMGSEELGAPDIARQLSLPRSTVFRLLSTLENMGFLERVGNNYRLGLAVLRLGYDYLATQGIARIAQPILKELCSQLGFTCNLALRDGASIVYVARVTPPIAFSGTVRVGTRLPAHSTVLGRVLMQDMDEAILRKVFGGFELQQFSTKTPKSVAQLSKLIEQDRLHGYAVGEGFYELGVSGIAAPVRDANGSIAAGLGVAIPFQEIEPESMTNWGQQVLQAASALSELLKAQQPAPG